MNFLKTTFEDKKIPTDRKLDSDIESLNWMLHNIYPFAKSIFIRKLKHILLHKWQIYFKRLLITSIVLGLVYYGYSLYMRPVVNKIIIQQHISEIEKDILSNPIPKPNVDFMVCVAMLESNSNYQSYRKNSQYWGAYQMGESARKEVGLENMQKDMFLNNKAIQNWAMNEYMKINYEYLKPYIAKYNIPLYGGKRIGMHIITISGLIASAHLVGHASVITFLKSNGTIIIKDGNGKPLTDYLELNNFKLEFDK